MSVLIQISDTHFGTEVPEVMNALLQLVSETRPDVAVLSGDLTQRARRSQFDAARAFADQLRVRFILALPGNHDIPLFNLFARIAAPYGNFQRAFGTNLAPKFESAQFLILGVNTTRAYRHKDGEVSAEQIQRVTKALRSASGEQIRIVVTHQPVHVIREKDEENLLHNAEQAVREWSAAGADLIMGGHIHLPYVRPLSDRFANLARRTWAVQAGTAVSYRIRHEAPNSINIVRRISAGELRCAVERWDYNAATQHFQMQHSELLEVDRKL